MISLSTWILPCVPFGTLQTAKLLFTMKGWKNQRDQYRPDEEQVDIYELLGIQPDEQNTETQNKDKVQFPDFQPSLEQAGEEYRSFIEMTLQTLWIRYLAVLLLIQTLMYVTRRTLLWNIRFRMKRLVGPRTNRSMWRVERCESSRLVCLFLQVQPERSKRNLQDFKIPRHASSSQIKNIIRISTWVSIWAIYLIPLRKLSHLPFGYPRSWKRVCEIFSVSDFHSVNNQENLATSRDKQSSHQATSPALKVEEFQ